LTVDEFEKRRGDKDAVVVDVRTPEEFAAGHIPGAINIPVQRSDFDQKVSALDKSKEYLVHCARGGRSATAASKMDKMGFKNLADFTGGMEAWKKANKPIDK
jgi:rhodanese-related sulfurtransferase